jgi:hypothetical protein
MGGLKYYEPAVQVPITIVDVILNLYHWILNPSGTVILFKDERLPNHTIQNA